MKSIFNWLFSPFKGEKWAENLHFILLGLAALFTILIAIFSYYNFNQKEIADYQLSKAKEELNQTVGLIEKHKKEIQELEERLEGNFSSDINILTEFYNDEDAHKKALIVTIEVKNLGTHDIKLKLKEDSLKIYKISYKDDLIKSKVELNPKYYQSLGNEITFFEEQIILQGAQKNLTYFSEVPSYGAYYITFQADTDRDLRNSLDKNNISENRVWFSSKYIVIKEQAKGRTLPEEKAYTFVN